MAAFDNKSEKPLHACLFLFEIPSKENYFKQSVANSLQPNCNEGYEGRRVLQEIFRSGMW